MLYGMASAGTVDWVMYQKFCNGLPYYRQEKDWKQYGVEITRATMANWVLRNSEAFFIAMYEYFHRKLLKRGFVMADETPLQVLHEPERRAQILAIIGGSNILLMPANSGRMTAEEFAENFNQMAQATDSPLRMRSNGTWGASKKISRTVRMSIHAPEIHESRSPVSAERNPRASGMIRRKRKR